MTRNQNWRGCRALPGALSVLLAVVLNLGNVPPSASAQASPQSPLSTDDLGPGWTFVNERWFLPPEGVGNYAAVFQRDPREGMTSRGPIAVTLSIDILPDTPPSDAVEQNITAFLNFAAPDGQARVFDDPSVGTNNLWYSFDLDLSGALPDITDLPAGVAYGVVFQNGNNVVNLTAVGFVGQLDLPDAVPIARA